MEELTVTPDAPLRVTDVPATVPVTPDRVRLPLVVRRKLPAMLLNLAVPAVRLAPVCVLMVPPEVNHCKSPMVTELSVLGKLRLMESPGLPMKATDAGMEAAATVTVPPVEAMDPPKDAELLPSS